MTSDGARVRRLRCTSHPHDLPVEDRAQRLQCTTRPSSGMAFRALPRGKERDGRVDRSQRWRKRRAPRLEFLGRTVSTTTTGENLHGPGLSVRLLSLRSDTRARPLVAFHACALVGKCCSTLRWLNVHCWNGQLVQITPGAATLCRGKTSCDNRPPDSAAYRSSFFVATTHSSHSRGVAQSKICCYNRQRCGTASFVLCLSSLLIDLLVH